MTITAQVEGIFERRDGQISRVLDVRTVEGRTIAVTDSGPNVLYWTGRAKVEDADSTKDFVRLIVVGGVWKPWNGDFVSPTMERVEVIYRTGDRQIGYASDFSWKWRKAGDDIVAYRCLLEAKQDECMAGAVDLSSSTIALQADIGQPSPQFFEPKIPAKLRDGLPERIMLERVANGGFIITDDCGIPGRINSVLAAISSEQDLLFWLTGKSPAASAAAAEKGVAP